MQRGPPTAKQLAKDATAARLIAEEEAAKATYFECLHLSGFKAPAEPLPVLLRIVVSMGKAKRMYTCN